MTLFLISSCHKSKITFSTLSSPFSRYIAPTKASQLSEIILSSILMFLLEGLKVFINLSRFIFFATERQVFLLTKDANFLSKTPSFSFGYISKSFFAITRPRTLSPKNSIFSLFCSLSKLLWVSDLISKFLFLKLTLIFFF